MECTGDRYKPLTNPPLYCLYIEDTILTILLYYRLHNSVECTGDRYKLLTNPPLYCLYIEDTQPTDAGDYTLKATNTHGESEAVISVTVLTPVPPEGKTISDSVQPNIADTLHETLKFSGNPWTLLMGPLRPR